mmetsp:Transcript_82229/g.266508  ORF Transcript_82229/g.266508 Transcript_82229/m.266508 type:complete len:228 (-) Transcript_82229:335-1018(-)
MQPLREVQGPKPRGELPQRRLHGSCGPGFHDLGQAQPRGLRLVEVHEVGVPAVLHELQEALGGLHRHGRAGAQRLHHDVAQRLEAAGRDEEVAGGVGHAQLLRPQHPPQRQHVAAPGRLDVVRVVRVAVAHDDQRAALGHGLGQQVDALLGRPPACVQQEGTRLVAQVGGPPRALSRRLALEVHGRPQELRGPEHRRPDRVHRHAIARPQELREDTGDGGVHGGEVR